MLILLTFRHDIGLDSSPVILEMRLTNRVHFPIPITCKIVYWYELPIWSWEYHNLQSYIVIVYNLTKNIFIVENTFGETAYMLSVLLKYISLIIKVYVSVKWLLVP